MTTAYEAQPARRGQPWTDMHVLALAVAVVAGAVQSLPLAVAWAVVVRATSRRRTVAACCLALAGVSALSAGRAWNDLQPQRLGPYAGWVTVTSDPAPIGRGTRLTLRIEGQRFDAWGYGQNRTRFGARQAGELVWVAGERRPLSGDERRAAVRHVVGTFRVDAVGDVVAGSGLARAGNRVRTALRAGAERAMGAADASLFTGLVIGDDARQPPWMLDDFRTSGLSHLTAVSGQNVAFVVAAAAPLLRRLRPWWRWGATIGLIGWFMAMTRFEPSVLRAGAMAMLAATAYVLGRQPSARRLVALAVIALVLIDPLLVWSVGFWLSVGATLGVCTVGPWLAMRLPGPHWLALSLGVTLGAQSGVALPSLLVFHRLPVVSIVANVAAVPVAGFVMLYGLPAGVVAAALPAAAGNAVLFPATLATRWTRTVAHVAAAVEPHGAVAVVAWAIVLAALAGWLAHARRSRVPPSRVPF